MSGKRVVVKETPYLATGRHVTFPFNLQAVSVFSRPVRAVKSLPERPGVCHGRRGWSRPSGVCHGRRGSVTAVGGGGGGL